MNDFFNIEFVPTHLFIKSLPMNRADRRAKKQKVIVRGFLPNTEPNKNGKETVFQLIKKLMLK